MQRPCYLFGLILLFSTGLYLIYRCIKKGDIIFLGPLAVILVGIGTSMTGIIAVRGWEGGAYLILGLLITVVGLLCFCGLLLYLKAGE